MRARVNRGEIPSEIGWLADWMDDVTRRLGILETATDVRQSYSDYLSSLGTTLSGSSSNNYGAAAYGPTLNFTLQTPRRVALEFVLDASATAFAGTATSTANGNLSAGLLVDGVALGNVIEGSLTAQVGGGASYATNRGDIKSAVLVCRAIVDLPAGAHTVQGRLATRVLGITGTGNASITYGSAQIFADVLQGGAT